MTILGIPDGSGFSIGTSTNVAPISGDAIDMSLDDMIKNRRKATTPKAAARKVSTADKSVAKGRATRQAGAAARRGIHAENKPTSMEVEREINRQAKMSVNNKAGKQKMELEPVKKAKRTRRVADVKVKAQNDKSKQQEKKDTNGTVPPTWIGGTRRPPSVKAVSAAVAAMESNGFKVPKGMQMVISFAPAPDVYPTSGKTPPKKPAQKPNNSNVSNTKGGNKPPQQTTVDQGASAKKPKPRRNRGKK